MIQTYLLMDFRCQIVNFVWGQYFINMSCKRINVVSKTEHDLQSRRDSDCHLWELINLYAQQRAFINSASPRSGIGVYVFQGENF